MLLASAKKGQLRKKPSKVQAGRNSKYCLNCWLQRQHSRIMGVCASQEACKEACRSLVCSDFILCGNPPFQLRNLYKKILEKNWEFGLGGLVLGIFSVCAVGGGQGEGDGLQHFLDRQLRFNALPASSACSGQAAHQLEEGFFQNISNFSCNWQKKILQHPALHI